MNIKEQIIVSLGVIEILEILGNIHENPELIGGEQ